MVTIILKQQNAVNSWCTSPWMSL